MHPGGNWSNWITSWGDQDIVALILLPGSTQQYATWWVPALPNTRTWAGTSSQEKLTLLQGRDILFILMTLIPPLGLDLRLHTFMLEYSIMASLLYILLSLFMLESCGIAFCCNHYYNDIISSTIAWIDQSLRTTSHQSNLLPTLFWLSKPHPTA